MHFMDILVFVKIWIIVLCFAKSFDEYLLEEGLQGFSP